MFSSLSRAGLDLVGDLTAPFWATADRDLVVVIVPMYEPEGSVFASPTRADVVLKVIRSRNYVTAACGS